MRYPAMREPLARLARRIKAVNRAGADCIQPVDLPPLLGIF
jgi:hypothetical protein